LGGRKQKKSCGVSGVLKMFWGDQQRGGEPQRIMRESLKLCVKEREDGLGHHRGEYLQRGKKNLSLGGEAKKRGVESDKN